MPNPPKPIALKRLEGTIKPSRLPKNEINPSIPIAFKDPDELNDWGLWFWKRIVEEYLPIGLLTNVDEGSLMILANEYGTYCEADDIIKAKGLEVEEEIYSQKGELVGSKTIANPMLKIRNDAFKNFNSLCSKFGITPSDRARLSAPDKVHGNPFEEFIN